MRNRVFFSAIAVIAVCAISLSVYHLEKSGAYAVSTTPVTQQTIIIDAGHGGFDGGAVAHDGTLEKELNLFVALELERVVNAFGFNTVMVRNTDKSTDSDGEQSGSKKAKDMKNRLQLMSKYENSIFISIHMNKYKTSQPFGTQVFYSPYPSSDALAECIQNSVASRLQPQNKRVIKPATREIYLLYNATTPAVIVECGFLSNEQDLANLSSENYRKELAFSIICGIINYQMQQ